MLQAAAEAESDYDGEEESKEGVAFGAPGFDFDAHIAKLIQAAEEHDVGSLRTAKTSKPLKSKGKGKDATHSHPRYLNLEDSDEDDAIAEGDEGFEEDDDDIWSGEEDEGKDGNDKFVGTAFHKVMMSEYADDNIGELDSEDPRVKGTGFHESVLEAAMNEFLHMHVDGDEDDEDFFDKPKMTKQQRKLAVGKKAGKSHDDNSGDDGECESGDGEDDDDDEVEDDEDGAGSNGSEGEGEDEEGQDDAAGSEGEGAEEQKASDIPTVGAVECSSHRNDAMVMCCCGGFAQEDVPFGCAPTDFVEEDESKMLIPRLPRRAKWDCATILSTYTNTENHPRVLSDIPVKSSASTVVSKSAYSKAVGAPKLIKLSTKTGIPVGVPLRGEVANKPSEEVTVPTDKPTEGDNSESGSEDGSGSDVDAAGRKPGENLGEARPRGETKEERKQRKAAVKEARKVCDCVVCFRWGLEVRIDLYMCVICRLNGKRRRA